MNDETLDVIEIILSLIAIIIIALSITAYVASDITKAFYFLLLAIAVR